METRVEKLRAHAIRDELALSLACRAGGGKNYLKLYILQEFAFSTLIAAVLTSLGNNNVFDT